MKMMMMVGFLCKALAIQVRFSRSSSSTFPFLHQHLYPFSSLSSSSSEAHSFTVSHLINSYGFSHKQALSASKYTNFKTPEKPNLVFAFFDSHGFSESQISEIVRSKPQILVSDPQKSLFPKLQFFYSKGASKPEVAKIVASCPTILTRSLKNQIIPYFNLLKEIFPSDEMAMRSIKCFPRALVDKPRCTESNINALQEIGVPKSNIAMLLTFQPKTFMVRPDHFKEVLEEVKEMGFDPSKIYFVVAVKVIRGQSKSTWKRKVEAYKGWGWSEEEIRLSFLKSPWCMVVSEDKLMAKMDFFVNKMGKESSLIARRPLLLSYSLEKRLIPRYSVVQFLLSKGLINKDLSFKAVFESNEKMFLHRFVNVYKEEAPQLLNLYQKNVTDSKKLDCLTEGSTTTCRMPTL